VVGGWRRLHNEELYNLYASPIIIIIIIIITSRKMRWARACSTHGHKEKCIKIFGWKTEVKRPLGRPRS